MKALIYCEQVQGITMKSAMVCLGPPLLSKTYFNLFFDRKSLSFSFNFFTSFTYKDLIIMFIEVFLVVFPLTSLAKSKKEQNYFKLEILKTLNFFHHCVLFNLFFGLSHKLFIFLILELFPILTVTFVFDCMWSQALSYSKYS